MTSKIEVPRELAEFLEKHVSGTCTRHALPRLEELRALLAAPEAPRQAPIGWFTDDYLTDKSATTYDELTSNRWKDKGWPVQSLYAAPLSPDHSGGGAGMVLPESCDAINAENAPTFMGEPNPHHSIDWYREGIAKHWKTICDQRERLESLTVALKFYADREHYHFESGNWDTVSGEPLNILWCGEEPDFIEDGTVARNCLDKVKELNQ